MALVFWEQAVSDLSAHDPVMHRIIQGYSDSMPEEFCHLGACNRRSADICQGSSQCLAESNNFDSGNHTGRIDGDRNRFVENMRAVGAKS